MNISDFSDAEIKAEAERRYERARKIERAADLLRGLAIDQKWNPGKKMTAYHAREAVKVACAALKIDEEVFAEAMFAHAKTVSATPPAPSED